MTSSTSHYSHTQLPPLYESWWLHVLWLAAGSVSELFPTVRSHLTAISRCDQVTWPQTTHVDCGAHFARCDEYVCSDASRPTSRELCGLDTRVTTWPTYIAHNKHIRRQIITASVAGVTVSDDTKDFYHPKTCRKFGIIVQLIFCEVRSVLFLTSVIFRWCSMSLFNASRSSVFSYAALELWLTAESCLFHIRVILGPGLYRFSFRYMGPSTYYITKNANFLTPPSPYNVI